MSEWLSNWPINWVGNSVGVADPPLQTRQHYSITASLSTGQISAGINWSTLQLIHAVTGGELYAAGQLILRRPGSRG